MCANSTTSHWTFKGVVVHPGHDIHYHLVPGYKTLRVSTGGFRTSVCDRLRPSNTPASPHRVFPDSHGDMAYDIPRELPPTLVDCSSPGTGTGRR